MERAQIARRSGLALHFERRGGDQAIRFERGALSRLHRALRPMRYALRLLRLLRVWASDHRCDL